MVYAIPIIPRSEKGASDDKFFIKHRGVRMIKVTPNKTLVRLISIPKKPDSMFLKVSARIILYAKFAIRQLKVLDAAVIHEVELPTVFSHASRYDLAPVSAQTRPIKENPYAEMAPMTAMRTDEGRIALGASPNAAIPFLKVSFYFIFNTSNYPL